MRLSRLIEYVLVTSWFWVCYATLLPIYFHFVFNWGWNQTVVWWITGTPVEFFLAYPIGKGLIKIHPWIRKIARLEKSESEKNAEIVERLKQWRDNLEALNSALQGNHTFANSVLPSIERILKEDKK